MSFYLEADPKVIGGRLAARAELCRLELTGSPGRELMLYNEAFQFLHRHDWAQERIDCRGMTPDEVVATILKRLDKYAR